MKNFVITKTINSLTEVIRNFDDSPDWCLIVTGDKKNPTDYKSKNDIYAIKGIVGGFF